MIRLDNNNYVNFTKEILSEVRNKDKRAVLGHAILSDFMLSHFSGIIPLRCGIHPTSLYMLLNIAVISTKQQTIFHCLPFL